ncbi:MAG: PspA/IM30 family protein, partial [Chloroflexota bacterium]|nr:PspA/IM30 family protein [Chloroflexota bacterium]
DERLLRQRWQENEEKANDWQRKAELAVERGQDDLAREALTRRNTFQATADGFREQYEQQRRQVEALKSALTQLEAKLQEARTKQDLLIARSRRAKAETQIRETMSGLDRSSALGHFARIEEKVAREEARAAALGELESDSTEHRFELLEADSEVDRQLAALKERKGLAAPQGRALRAGEETSPGEASGVDLESGPGTRP